MCTVSFIKTSNGFILTSSRDEKEYRETLPPTYHKYNETMLMHPTDVIAGGTWIAASNQNRFACLLNGAFIKHTHKSKYDRSRGVVLLESFNYSSIDDFTSNVNLNNVEPFTLLLINQYSQITEMRWDGLNKYIKEANSLSPKLWQSATLYNHSIQQKRQIWFENWIEQHNDIEDNNIFNFHHSKHSDDMQNDIMMERSNGLKTVSISQIKFSTSGFDFIYLDCLKEQQTILSSNFK